MKINNIKNFTNGWMIGNFNPSLLKNEHFEFGYKKIIKETHIDDPHYHKIITEYNFILNGKILIKGENFNHIFNSGDIFIIEPNEIYTWTILEDTDLFIIKTPSIINDKYFV